MLAENPEKDIRDLSIACDYIDETLSELEDKIRTAYPYLNKEFISEIVRDAKPCIMAKCRIRMNLIVDVEEAQISNLERDVNSILNAFENLCIEQNYENQFQDHDTTHKKYPQFTPKDCIVWDNSMKHLADKKGIAWKDKTIRQRHIDVIEKMKKEKLSPWEARLVRIS